MPPNFMTRRSLMRWPGGSGECPFPLWSRANDLEDRLLDLFRREAGGIQIQRVGRLGERRFGARAVARSRSADLAGDVDRPARPVSAARRRARSSGSASRKILTWASGNTTVPISRPSITTLAFAADARAASSRSARRTPANGRHLRGGGGDLRSANGGGDVFAVQKNPVWVTVRTTAWIGENPMRAAFASCSIRRASAGSVPSRNAHRATARYMAPLSM